MNAFREQDAENAAMALDYYSAAIHRGALSLPPFMRRQFDKCDA